MVFSACSPYLLAKKVPKITFCGKTDPLIDGFSGSGWRLAAAQGAESKFSHRARRTPFCLFSFLLLAPLLSRGGRSCWFRQQRQRPWRDAQVAAHSGSAACASKAASSRSPRFLVRWAAKRASLAAGSKSAKHTRSRFLRSRACFSFDAAIWMPEFLARRSRVPSAQFTALARVEENRACAALARAAGVPVGEVRATPRPHCCEWC